MDSGPAPTSQTRRAAVLALAAHVALAAAAALAWSGGAGPLVAVALTAAGAAGAASITFLWLGRDEFDATQRRNALWALQGFLVSASLLLAVLLSITSTVAETGRLGDLMAPLYVLPVLLAVEGAATVVAFWNHASGAARAALALVPTAGGATGVALLVHGKRVVDDLRQAFGDGVVDAATRDDALEAFHAAIVPAWMAYVLASRLALAWALWIVLGRLVRLEEAAGRDAKRLSPPSASP